MRRYEFMPSLSGLGVSLLVLSQSIALYVLVLYIVPISYILIGFHLNSSWTSVYTFDYVFLSYRNAIYFESAFLLSTGYASVTNVKYSRKTNLLYTIYKKNRRKLFKVLQITLPIGLVSGTFMHTRPDIFDSRSDGRDFDIDGWSNPSGVELIIPKEEYEMVKDAISYRAAW